MLSPDTDDASTEHFRTSSKQPNYVENFGSLSLRYLSIHNFDQEIETSISEIILSGIWDYSFTRFAKPQKRWTHIQMDSVQTFISILIDSFDIVFEEQPFQFLLIS